MHKGRPKNFIFTTKSKKGIVDEIRVWNRTINGSKIVKDGFDFPYVGIHTLTLGLFNVGEKLIKRPATP